MFRFRNFGTTVGNGERSEEKRYHKARGRPLREENDDKNGRIGKRRYNYGYLSAYFSLCADTWGGKWGQPFVVISIDCMLKPIVLAILKI